jgi:hypothetical protein
MGYHWYDVVGNVGVALIIGMYFLLQLGRVRAQTVTYSFANALGAAMVMLSLIFDFNLSAFVVECFWTAISLFGMVRAVRISRGST